MIGTGNKVSATAGLAKEIGAALDSLSQPSTAQMRTLRRRFSQQLEQYPAESVIELARMLIDRAVPRFFAYELVQHHQEAARRLDARALVKLGEGMASWEGVDTFASYLSGPAWRERQVPDTLILRWARSSNRWWRRAALVSTVPLNTKARGGSGDTPRTLKVCELLIADRDDMVVKALSWALRELAKRDPEAARSFVSQHIAALALRVTREVTTKLTTGLKNPSKRRIPKRATSRRN